MLSENWAESKAFRLLSPQGRLSLKAHQASQAKSAATTRQAPEFRANLLRLQTDAGRQIIVSGMARTGKSFAALYKLHKAAEAHKGMRGLIIRKTRESLNESGLLTLERDVLGEANPIIPRGQRFTRHSYRYPNGSEIVVAGLLASGKDQKAKVMSTEYDLIFVQEAAELLEAEWQQLTTRLSNFRMPYQQIIGDCNPDAPTHWIKRNGDAGRLTLLHSTLQDNPRWWANGDWTPEGLEVYTTLGNLTGVQRQRYFEGKWVQATGLVYGDEWSDGPLDGNVTETAEYMPGAGPVFWAVDDGYVGDLDAATGEFTADSHPRVFLLVQQTAVGILHVFAESYAIKKHPEIHLNEVLALPYPAPDWAAVDQSAAELRGRLHAIGIYTRKGPPSVEESIKVFRDWIAPDSNGVRKLLVHPRCRHSRAEMASYRRDTDGKIVKQFDHMPDAGRYLTWALRHAS